MNKYYIPDITEFHVGLEYEVKDPFVRDWKKDVACTKDFLGHDIPCSPSEFYLVDFGWKKKEFELHSRIPKDDIQYELVDGIMEPTLPNYRIKYLDREDIESFGFTNLPDTNSFEYGEYQIYFQDSDFLQVFNFDSKVIFEGSIKNKSELKKLLKQLKIID